MSKLLSTILGIAFLSCGTILIGSYPRSAQLICQKVQTHIADCRTEVNTIAGWGASGIDQYMEIRQAKVALVTAKRARSRTKTSFSTTTYGNFQIVKLYPIFLTDRTGHKFKLEKVIQHHEPTAHRIVDGINQFIQSSQTEIIIDLNSDWPENSNKENNIQQQIVGQHIILGSILSFMGVLLLLLPWLFPWLKERSLLLNKL
jgi:hypothetical protein